MAIEVTQIIRKACGGKKSVKIETVKVKKEQTEGENLESYTKATRDHNVMWAMMEEKLVGKWSASKTPEEKEKYASALRRHGSPAADWASWGAKPNWGAKKSVSEIENDLEVIAKYSKNISEDFMNYAKAETYPGLLVEWRKMQGELAEGKKRREQAKKERDGKEKKTKMTKSSEVDAAISALETVTKAMDTVTGRELTRENLTGKKLRANKIVGS